MNNNQNNNIPNSTVPNSLANMKPTLPNQANEQNQNNLYMNQINNLNTNNTNSNVQSKKIENPNPITQLNNQQNVQQNKFINYDTQPTEAVINDLNVEGTYNKLEKPAYTNEPQVRENIENAKKNTIPVSKELKTVIIIALLLLIFIIFIPMIFEFINDIRFH